MEAINLEGHNHPIYAVVAHPTQNLCYTAGNDKGIVEWTTQTQKFSKIFNSVTHTVYVLEIISDYHFLVAGCSNGHILFFDLEDGVLRFTKDVKFAVFCIKYCPTKKALLVANNAGEIIIFDIEKQKKIYSFNAGTQKIRAFDFNAQLNILAIASNDNFVRLYKLNDYTFINSFKAHTMGVGAIAFDPSGQKMLTGARNAYLKFWDTQNWLCLQKIAAHLFAIYQITFHPYLPYFATCSRDKSIKIWRTTNGSLYKNLSLNKKIDGHRLSVNQICWSANGKNLISVSDDKVVKIWLFSS
jgi:WD40 repeat protein